MSLSESSLYSDINDALSLERSYQLIAPDEYNTTLRSSCGSYYVTNRYDPRIVQWCKENNVKPEDR